MQTTKKVRKHGSIALRSVSFLTQGVFAMGLQLIKKHSQ